MRQIDQFFSQTTYFGINRHTEGLSPSHLPSMIGAEQYPIYERPTQKHWEKKELGGGGGTGHAEHYL